MLRLKTPFCVRKPQTLTQLGRFAEDKGVRPELADRSIIEALITDGAPETAAAQDVDHVGAGPDRSNNTANQATEEEKTEVVSII